MGATETIQHTGTAALTGWRQTAARAVAKPVSERTRFTQEQVEAAIGILVLAFALYRVIRPLLTGVRR